MRIIILACLLACISFAAMPVFEHSYEFSLKKDERASVSITELAYDDTQNFDFYWTLFDTNKIIVHTRYRKFSRQFVLALRRNLNWATQTLIPDYTNPHIDRARLILEFSDFSRGEAKFKVYIEDKQARLAVDFLDPNKLDPSKASDATRIVPGIYFSEEKNASLELNPQTQDFPQNLEPNEAQQGDTEAVLNQEN